MRRVLLILILSVVPMLSFGQLSVGLSGGYTHNILEADPGYYDRDYVAEQGYSVSIPVHYSLTEWLAVRGELGYMKKNYSWMRSVTYSEYEYHSNGYLQLPLMVNLSLGGERLRGFVNLGGYVGAWVDASLTGYTFSMYGSSYYIFEDQEYEFDSSLDNRFDAGLLGGIGVEYRWKHNISITAEGRLLYGLTNTQKSYMYDQYPRYNTTILIQAGISYRFTL